MKFLNDYFSEYKRLLKFDEKEIHKILALKKTIKKVKKSKKKILIFGNGGSAAIASHFSVDLTKNAKVRAVNFNEADLITCFSNDYGYENWVKRTIEFHADRRDLIILISSSGESKNMINACKFALKKKHFPIITFTGFKKNNSLSKLGHINFWINSKKYNHVENTHQFLLLSLADSLKINV